MLHSPGRPRGRVRSGVSHEDWVGALDRRAHAWDVLASAFGPESTMVDGPSMGGSADGIVAPA